MKFCMVTSFFGEYSFGGDSIYIERLCQALLNYGHEVHVAYSPGAFGSIRRKAPLREYEAPGNLVLHPLNNEGPKGRMDALWSHQTGRSGRLHNKLENLFRRCSFDVIHLHNISLMGAENLLRMACRKGGATTLMTIHDYWWLCPQSLFWKFGRLVCDSPECIMCNIRRRVPPQFWRRKGVFDRALSELDVVFFPSQTAAEVYRTNGFDHSSMRILPGIIPEGWEQDSVSETSKNEIKPRGRPYFAAAGRLVLEKGFHTLIPFMKNFPDLDLLIAGEGPLRNELELLSRELENVRFLGLISSKKVKHLFQGARAVIVPSLSPETFGLVAAEALSLNVPVIARRSGALPELIDSARGGELYQNEEDLFSILKRFSKQINEKSSLDIHSEFHPPGVWFEGNHVDRYLNIITESLHPRRKGEVI